MMDETRTAAAPSRKVLDSAILTSGGYGSVERDLVADVFAPAPTPLEWPVC
jgi:hypothetical protein